MKYWSRVLEQAFTGLFMANVLIYDRNYSHVANVYVIDY